MKELRKLYDKLQLGADIGVGFQPPVADRNFKQFKLPCIAGGKRRLLKERDDLGRKSDDLAWIHEGRAKYHYCL